MSALAFFGDEARAKVAKAIAEAEQQTCAEVVVSVRRISGHYRNADYLFGFIIALSALVGLLFLPQEFDINWWPLDVLLAFVAGTMIAANLPALRRVFVGKKRLRDEVDKAAQQTFYKQGISRTRDRCGILVYASLFERHAALVPDVGVDTTALSHEWHEAIAAVEAAVHQQNLEAFIAAVRNLGEIVGRAHPRSEDDVNELPDEMHVA